jgi:poly(3-hydroxybutyrate) depolymerase
VTGVSSGGFMATQLQVAYSRTFSGAGIVAAGPYDCGQGTVGGVGVCLLGAGLPTLEQQAVTWSGQGLIDPVAGLAGKRIYTFHGTLDPVVTTVASDDGVAFYQHFGANVQYDNTTPAGHSWVSPRGVVACPLTAAPFINDCGTDPEGEMLRQWFGAVNAPNTAAAAGTLASFDQNPYIPGGDAPAISMDDTGLLYTPPACADGARCRLVVAFHGCLAGQVYIGDAFPDLGYLDNYADTNNLVVLYPQAIPSVLPYNPEGCWDWWGYDGGNFAVHGAPQMVATMNMVHALGG